MENEKNKTELKHEELSAVSGGIKYDPEWGYSIAPLEWFRNRMCKLYCQVLSRSTNVDENATIECREYFDNGGFDLVPGGKVSYSLHTLLTEFDALGQTPDPRKEW